jgi:SAM-dependent methyltransferase
MAADRADRRSVYASAEFWEGKVRDYDGSAVSMFANRNLNVRLERDQFAFIDHVLGDVHGTRVLDVGAGTGRVSRHLARRGASVLSLDFAATAVDVARRGNGDLPIEARVMSVFDLEDEASCDHAVVLACLSAACRDRAALLDSARRIRRALRPGARIAMIEPFHAGRLSRVLDMSLDHVIAALEEVGFKVQERAELHFWPARLVLSPIEWPAFATTLVHAAGEAVLRLAGPRSGLGDYKGLGLLSP